MTMYSPSNTEIATSKKVAIFTNKQEALSDWLLANSF
ncbi:hypothetical protein HMPREF9700_01752 [Bergeyella zoohelcum CCUG 30536]|uniref:Uncharacterized protein n=1 Tax=Bergeyella zoohelcum TaxID=1015 RepID=A0A380ZVB7_9FLAO|nr:hypothetical protein HMPREF9700_01752 [Bergeyella zoohelcum CCUG 30536]SUV53243.1 Uncharacterised protein [Bergeyella zoohelcum]